MRSQEPLESWERELDRELSALPDLEAPTTLMPGVMARLQAPVKVAWYHSAWWQWPATLRTASLGGALALLAVLGWLSVGIGDLGLWRQLTVLALEVKETVDFTLTTLETTLGAGAVFWSRYGQPILIAVAALLILTYLMCIAAGTALYRLAWRRIS